MFLDFAAWLQSTDPSLVIQRVTWVIPLTQSIHIIAIGIVFVSILLLTLRVLGVARTDERFEALAHRFMPWIGYGLVVMAATGAILVVGEPLREFSTLSFWLKMALLLVAVLSGFALLKTLRSAQLPSDSQREFARTTKAAALVVLSLWVCIIYLGRTIAYDIEVWESYSLAAEPQAGQTE